MPGLVMVMFYSSDIFDLVDTVVIVALGEPVFVRGKPGTGVDGDTEGDWISRVSVGSQQSESARWHGREVGGVWG